MDFTFGIITDKGKEDNINKMIDSIEAQNIPYHEVIIIGDCSLNRDMKKIRIYSFDESLKKMWITRKKNAITYYAIMENIVFMHDYIVLESGWYEGFKKIGHHNFQIASNIIIDNRGQRQIDWSLWPGDLSFLPKEIINSHKFLLPYNITNLSKYMYFSGSYWVGKKYVMQEFPLNENLVWGQGEDVEWSERVKTKYNFTFNPYSTVKYLKEKGNPFSETTSEIIEKIRQQ